VKPLGIAVLAIGLFAGALGASRSAGVVDSPSRAAVLGSSLPVEAPAPSATPRVWRAPRAVPITPVLVQYEALDPAFEPLAGARAVYGTYEGGAYQIEVPDNWNGSVVYFAHGFRGNPPALVVSQPVLRRHFIERGFAWVASSYSRNGYEPGVGARDTLALRPIVEQRVGIPQRSYLYGESMGGNVVTYLLEHDPLVYDGAVTECGVVAGPEVLDYFLSWAVLGQYLTGVDFIDAGSSAADRDSIIATRVLPALGTVDEPTATGSAFFNAIEQLTGGPRPFFDEGLAANLVGNFMIIAHAVDLAGPSGAAAQNIDTLYTIAPAFPVTADRLNGGIERFAPAPAYANATAYPEFQPMTGRIERPLLTLHGTGDLLVPIALEQSYRRTVGAAGRGDLLVQRAVRRAGHCNFSLEERTHAFDDLVAWVEHDLRPAGEDLSGSLRNAGLLFTSPLEPSDPGAVITVLDEPALP